MKNRILQLPENKTFFLFGARNTGKSTLIKHYFKKKKHRYIDLLDLNQEQIYLHDPQHLKAEVLGLPDTTKIIIIDEIQKIPELLDVVHALIEEVDKQFVLTGSSARKLKYGHANLLAGRAFVRNLYPFTFLELGEDFDLNTVLRFGAFPKVNTYQLDQDKADFLRAYAHVYLKEEIWAEHFIRKLPPFQYFLEVAAQSNGDIINASSISRTVGVDDKSIVKYYAILEDTLLGFHLSAYHHSFRKRLISKPKFYFIDTGITRALSRQLTLPLHEGSYEYGKYFEHFIIVECYKLVQYYYPDYRLSYLKTTDGLEIDLVIERPGKPLLLIEIKSAKEIKPEHLKPLRKLSTEFDKPVEPICFANVENTLSFDGIMVYPWREGIGKFLVAENE